MQEEDIVDRHDRNSFADTGSHIGNNTVGQQLVECLDNGAEGHAFYQFQ